MELTSRLASNSVFKWRKSNTSRGHDPHLLDFPPGLDDLLVTLGGEGDVDPPRELVLEVPRRFAVPDEDQRVLIGRLEGGEAAWAREMAARE